MDTYPLGLTADPILLFNSNPGNTKNSKNDKNKMYLCLLFLGDVPRELEGGKSTDPTPVFIN